MPAAPVVFKAAELLVRHHIGMAWPRDIPLLFVISAAGVVIFEKDSNGSPGCFTIEDTGFYLWDIIFPAGSGSLAAALSSFNICEEIICRQGQAGRAAINADAHQFAMRLAEDMNAEYAAQTIQVVELVYCKDTSAPSIFKSS